MTRTVALAALALFLAGCTGYRSTPGGPFAKPKKEPPLPYGAVAPLTPAVRPVGGQSPLGMAAAEPLPPLPPDERTIVPTRPPSVLPAAAAATGFGMK